jgi:hypothetical protein
LVGVLDLVRSGSRIVDFKSAAKTADNDMALHQNGVKLDCYSILYRESTGKREAGRELHHLIKTKVGNSPQHRVARFSFHKKLLVLVTHLGSFTAPIRKFSHSLALC